jgi:hypothetical protein
MRTIEFKMEREGLVKVGDEVQVDESELSTLQGVMYYYTIIPALAMSNNIPSRQRLKQLRGKVSDVKVTESASFVYVDFNE